MAKAYRVTPQLPMGKNTYTARFRNASGVRVNRSLDTTDLGVARHRARGLERLFAVKPAHLGDIPAGNEIDLKAQELYFGLTRVEPSEKVDHGHPPDYKRIGRFADKGEKTDLALAEDARRAAEGHSERTTTQYLSLKAQLEETTSKLERLEQSALGQSVRRTAAIPSLESSLADCGKHLASTTSAKNTASILAIWREFLVYLPEPKPKTFAQITPAQIGRFLDYETDRTNPPKPLSRRRNLHLRLARFANWGSQIYGLASPMKGIAIPQAKRMRRERGVIVWHEKSEIAAMLNTLPARLEAARRVTAGGDSTYWEALVATLAYAGLQLAELVWLRVADVDFSAGVIRVQPVKVGAEEHLLKTGNREREVNIHPKLLRSRLERFVAGGHGGKQFFFARPKDMPNHRQESERWLEGTLSHVLLGRKGLKGSTKRPPTPGILPPGMNALTLRHTFGSLLLRAGLSYDQIAEAMGNTPEVVREHYARLKGSEVPVAF